LRCNQMVHQPDSGIHETAVTHVRPAPMTRQEGLNFLLLHVRQLMAPGGLWHLLVASVCMYGLLRVPRSRGGSYADDLKRR
jgi:hypothetical protein